MTRSADVGDARLADVTFGPLPALRIAGIQVCGRGADAITTAVADLLPGMLRYLPKKDPGGWDLTLIYDIGADGSVALTGGLETTLPHVIGLPTIARADAAERGVRARTNVPTRNIAAAFSALDDYLRERALRVVGPRRQIIEDVGGVWICAPVGPL